MPWSEDLTIKPELLSLSSEGVLVRFGQIDPIPAHLAFTTIWFIAIGIISANSSDQTRGKAFGNMSCTKTCTQLHVMCTCKVGKGLLHPILYMHVQYLRCSVVVKGGGGAWEGLLSLECQPQSFVLEHYSSAKVRRVWHLRLVTANHT